VFKRNSSRGPETDRRDLRERYEKHKRMAAHAASVMSWFKQSAPRYPRVGAHAAKIREPRISDLHKRPTSVFRATCLICHHMRCSKTRYDAAVYRSPIDLRQIFRSAPPDAKSYYFGRFTDAAVLQGFIRLRYRHRLEQFRQKCGRLRVRNCVSSRDRALATILFSPNALVDGRRTRSTVT